MKNSSIILIGIFVVIVSIVIGFFAITLIKKPLVMEEEIDCVTACTRSGGEQPVCTNICPLNFIELGTHKCGLQKCCCYIPKPTEYYGSSVVIDCDEICSGYPYNKMIGTETILTCPEYCDSECSDWNEECTTSEQIDECCCYSCR